MWSEGIAKTASVDARVVARESKPLVTNWIGTEGIAKFGEKAQVSSRILQSAAARSPKSLMSQWVVSNGLGRLSFSADAVRSPTPSLSLASRWLFSDGMARVPAWINAENIAARQGASKSVLATSWLSSGIPKMGGKIALPLTAVVAMAGASYYAKDIYAKGKKSAGLLVRRSSMEGSARLALKYV